MKKLKSNLSLLCFGAAIVGSVLPGVTHAAPFTLTLTTSFDCGSATPPVGAGSVNCSAALPQHLEWIQGSLPVSSLDLTDTVQNNVNPGSPAVIIGTIKHTNVVIPSEFSYTIDILNSFSVKDQADASVDNFPTQAVGITFTESLNSLPCPAPNPEGSVCDDFFTFDVSGLTPVSFTDSEGLLRQVSFGLIAGPGTTIVGDQVFTAENATSTISFTAKIEPVDAPPSMLLLGVGLLILGFAS